MWEMMSSTVSDDRLTARKIVRSRAKLSCGSVHYSMLE